MNNDIVSWLKRQENWLQEVATKILEKDSLDDSNIEELASYIKSQEGRKVSTDRTFNNLANDTTTTSSLRIRSICDISNIDALSPRKPLTFDDKNIVVVYGGNGSGKSGYTRILKKICGKPNAIELQTNVYNSTTTSGECTIKYLIDEEEHSETWIANSRAIENLRTLDIFDSDTAKIYLSQANEATYIPKQLILFERMVQVSNKIKQKLEDEAKTFTKKLPTLPTQYIGTTVGNVYNNLTKDINLKSTFIWNDESKEKQAGLSLRLATDDPKALAKKLRDKKNKIKKLYEDIEKALQLISNDACQVLNTLKQEAIAKRKIAQESAQKQVSLSELEGVGSDTWRALWEAARNYSITEAYKEKSFPNTEDNALCVLCHQELSGDAKKRLNDFNAYIKGELEKNAKEAENTLKDTREKLPTVPSTEILGNTIQMIELNEKEWGEKISQVWNTINIKIEEMKISENDIIRLDNTDILIVVNELKEIEKSFENKALQYDIDASGFNREEAKKELLELDSKAWIAEQTETLKIELARLKMLSNYEKWKKMTNTRGISTKASELSESIITQAYIDRFNKELQILNASYIQVELKKTNASQGKVKHQIKLKNTQTDKPIVKILSDGEQRIVALAGFLADVGSQNSLSPFVFDDPISSLDQDFEEATIRRLILLSESRQVIIFTHRLSFLGIINNNADDLTQIHIRKEPWGSGEIGEIPLFGKSPEKALKNLKNNRLIQARKAYEEEGNDIYYPLAKAICSDYRILLERVVEFYFLADVVQRHRRSVNTMGKINKLAKITEDDCKLIDTYMTKYSAYEHSQPLETPPIVPLPDELESDIDAILNWYTEFKVR